MADGDEYFVPPRLRIRRAMKPKVTSSLPLTNDHDKPSVWSDILTVVSVTTSSICFGSPHLLPKVAPGVAITVSASASSRSQIAAARSISFQYLTDRLHFKRTAKLPLPSLEAVKPPNDRLGKCRHHHEPYIALHASHQFPSALCDSAPGPQPSLMNPWH